jgi:O-antigen/teichoic acid export membrane protein
VIGSGRIADALRRWVTGDASLSSDLDSVEFWRRSRERRAVASSVFAVAARGVLLVATLVTIPLLISYLGAERFGVFVALTSLTSLFVFADLGLGNGLLTMVSDANGREDRATAQRVVSSGFFMLAAIALFVGAVGAVIGPTIDWADLLNVSSAGASEVAPTLLVLVGLFAVGLPLGSAERIRLAYQEGYINSVLAMSGTIGGLAGLALAIAARSSMPILILSVSAPPVVALGINCALLFWRDRPWLRPRWALATVPDAARLVRIGFLFFVLQVAVAIAFQADALVAATIIGPEAAATYAVTVRLFMFVPSVMGLFLLTLWPAYTEALARKDSSWVLSALRRSVLICGGFSLAAAGLLLVFGQWMIRLLTGGQIEPPIALMVGAAVWAVIYAVFSAVAILMNAAAIVFFQVVVAVVMATGSVALSILFGVWFGVAGVVWGTVLAYVILAAIPIAVYLPGMLRRLNDGTLGMRQDG